MQRVYASTILAQPRIVNYRGKQLMVRAIQTPIKRSTDPLRALANFQTRRDITTLPVTSHRRLNLVAVEEQGESGFYTLVYDQGNLFPIVNFRNQVLNATEIQALEIDPQVRAEVVSEVKTSLFTAGPGHYSRLVRTHNQEGFKFIVDQVAAFEPILKLIENKGALYAFVRRAIIQSFTQFYLGPSSTSAKYHPIDEITIAGLLHHSKRVAYLALKLAQSLNLSQSTRQEIVAAAILHDICKGVKKAEDGAFVWDFHSTADHGVFGAEWLEQVLTQQFPNMRGSDKARARRVMKSVYYHSNIWVDNFDTEITAQNSIADWIVSLADFAASHKHVRMDYPGAKQISADEAINSILSNPIDYEWEQLHGAWPNLSLKQKRGLLIASMCFRQYEIVEPAKQQQIIEAILAENIPTTDHRELVKDKAKLTIWAAVTIANTAELKMYLREDIEAALEQAEIKEAVWRMDPVDDRVVMGNAHPLIYHFMKNFKDEFWDLQKGSLLNLLNSRVKSDPVLPEELDDELLLEMMLKYGTLDVEEIYWQICGLWAKKAEVRAVIKASGAKHPQDILKELETVFERSGYSSTAVSKAEEKLRQGLNKLLDYEEKQLKPILEKLLAVLPDKVKRYFDDADVLKFPRKTSRRIFARIKAQGIELEGSLRSALAAELEYIQRLPFNRMNKDIIAWLMERYAGNAEDIFRAIKYIDPAILKKYEAETRDLEVEYLGIQGKKSIPMALRMQLLARAQAELEPYLTPAIQRQAMYAGRIQELATVSRFIENYHIEMVEFLKFARDPANYRQYDYFPQMDKAVGLIFDSAKKADADHKIAVYGDYDADGICGTTILMKALHELFPGKKEFFGFHIPPRQRGFGPNNQSFEELIDAGYTTFITNDNGISGKAVIDHARQYAAQKGIELTIIITDHHSIPDELPDANAIIHPKLLDKKHPARYLAGAAVAYKLARALYDRAGVDIGTKFLEYVFVATFADVVAMPQQSENRALAWFGGQKLNPALKLLAEVEEKQREAYENHEIEKEDLFNAQEFLESGLDIGFYLLVKLAKIRKFDRTSTGFTFAPRINAISRILGGGANFVVELFLTTNVAEAIAKAEKMEMLNQRRKELQHRMEQEALEKFAAMVENEEFDPEKDRAIIMTEETWPRAMGGLVASFLADLTKGMAGVGTQKGLSWRTIPGLHVLKALQKAVELYHADGNEDTLLVNFGGHAGAAGSTIKEDKHKIFEIYVKRAAFELCQKNEDFAKIYGTGKPKKLVQVDAYMPAKQISASLYQLLTLFSPFGQQTYGKFDEVPCPTFASKRLKVIDFGVLGGLQDHLQVTLENEFGNQIKGPYFRANDLATKKMLYSGSADKDVFVDIAYSIDLDHKGQPQVLIIDMQPSKDH